ncbi:BQ2448_5123 [Microbotryum intermedium]|uniref:BQ2448_5123 protein n=1 Tax=Microbotryum intermedium TaxID=269621 RepID=A0A238F063_9BASI|nr:BQ2448_5123 [Microbotryum intermedium]
MSLATRGIAVTAVRHDYEKEAACGRCHFVGHVGSCAVEKERQRKEMEELVRKGVRERAAMGGGRAKQDAHIITNNNNITSNNKNGNNITTPEAVAPVHTPGANALESQNRFAGLQVEDGNEEEADVIKAEGEDGADVDERGESEEDGIDEDEVMCDGIGEDEEEEVATEVEETATEVNTETMATEVEQEVEEEEKDTNDDDATTATTVSRDSTPRDPTPPLSPGTLAKSLREGEEWDKAGGQTRSRGPFGPTQLRDVGKGGGDPRHHIRGTAAKKQQMKRSQTAADLSDPSDEPVDAKRVVVKGKNRAGRADVTEGRRVTREMSAAAVGVIAGGMCYHRRLPSSFSVG